MRWRNIISRRTNCWCCFFWHATTADAIRRGIAQYEGVSKGLVARSVESLVEKQFLVVERDAADKRICHLYLTQQCSALTEQMTEKKAAFFRRLAEGIPEEAIATTEQTLRRFMENISASIDKS